LLTATLLCVVVVFVGVVSGECNTERYLASLNITVSEVTCYGGSNAVVTIESNDTDSGCNLMLYTMKKGDKQSSSKKVFEGLSAGVYELIAKFEGGISASINITVGSMSEMTYTYTVEDYNNLICDECLAEATIFMSGGVGPYKFDNETYENATFLLPWLCYGNTSFSVTDANNCTVVLIFELPIPEWCLMDNESSSSYTRDYWTLPDGMLPWLIVVCAVVALFLVGTFIACCSWSCLSERTLAEPKQKLLEKGEKTASSAAVTAEPRNDDLNDDKKVDFEPEPEPKKKQDKLSDAEESDKEKDKEEEKDKDKEEKKSEKKKSEKHKKSSSKHEKKKKSEEEPVKGEVELDLMGDDGGASDDDNKGQTIAKRRKKKSQSQSRPSQPKRHKAEDDDSQVELETME